MELVTIHEPGDRIWTISNTGHARVYVVQHDGTLALAIWTISNTGHARVYVVQHDGTLALAVGSY
jgi:hypothetical protein